jgi:MFS family permease
MVLTGWYIGRDPETHRFYWVIAVLIAASLARCALLTRLPHVPPSRTGPREPLLHSLRRPLRDRGFLRFLTFAGSVVASGTLVGPFLVPYLKRDLGFPSSLTVYASAAMTLGSIVTILAWGRAADRWGNRLVYLVSIGLLVTALCLLACAPLYAASPHGAMIVAMAGFGLRGVAAAGIGIAQTVRLMHASPPRFRAAYMGLFVFTVGLVAACVSLLSGAVQDMLPDRLTVAGVVFPPLRLMLPGVGLLLVGTLAILRGLERVSEPPIREAMYGLGETLPWPLAVPFSLLGREPETRP